MLDPLSLSIGIGLIVGLLMVDLIGLYAGGMVVPGYLALDMHAPGNIALTVIDAIIIYLIMRLLSNFMIIYGRRRVALIVLIAFILGVTMRQLFSSLYVASTLGSVYSVIGYIIPGLIALAIERQGLIETVTSLITASIIVRLFLILTIGSVLLP
ncbi:MAG: poly-gamma-glutamate biosynthesis protein PgsC [Coxiellaceae bacterium]|nr:poly-gamma-glutamate biosynthesis protein PgsC [Coxiellaceae bacterium]|tara:strand:+ start:4219 stop:4683 length:465 start_codon:yes stop_codon:yes gene_type:complete